MLPYMTDDVQDSENLVLRMASVLFICLAIIKLRRELVTFVKHGAGYGVHTILPIPHEVITP